MLQDKETNITYESLLQIHSEKWPSATPKVARAPGRVNLIGEHTDYNGLPVMPAAIDREISVAFSDSLSAEVNIANTKNDYGVHSFQMSDNIERSEMGDWSNYVKAACQAVWNWAAENQPKKMPLNGYNAVFSGSIPAGSGLSSSSALVVASAIALVDINKLNISKSDLAELLAKGERYVGTEGGGMDQAASLLARPLSAIKIDFVPIRTTLVKMPQNARIVIANSMVEAKKTGGAREAYNTRVTECKLGLCALKSRAKSRYPEVTDAKLLRDFKETVSNWQDYLDDLPGLPVTLDEIAEYCGSTIDWLVSQLSSPSSDVYDKTFQIKKRCRHVLTEGDRVEKAVDYLGSARSLDFGKLMDESHASCANDYEISCRELDELVGIIRNHGAYGARLTGAGFGGCAVALVDQDKAKSLVDGVWNDYHLGYLETLGYTLSESLKEQIVFECTPSGGADIIQ